MYLLEQVAEGSGSFSLSATVSWFSIISYWAYGRSDWVTCYGLHDADELNGPLLAFTFMKEMYFQKKI